MSRSRLTTPPRSTMNMTPQVLNPETSLVPGHVQVGDGVYESIGSDRRAGTVTYVSPSGKTIRFTHDDAQMKPGHSIHSANGQEYDFTSEPERTWEDPFRGTQTNARTARWSPKRQRFLVNGYAIGKGRRHYYDPSF